MEKKKKNVILFVIDALRADHLGCYGYEKNTSPTIDRLAEKGIKFNNAFCCANITDPSVTSIMSGRYPMSHGIRNHGGQVTRAEKDRLSKSGTRFLPEILKDSGYSTFALDWLGRWHKEGFDHYSGNIKKSQSFRFVKRVLNRLPDSISDKIREIYHKRQESSSHLSNMPNARELIEESIKMMKKDQQPFFILSHMWDTHTPYNFNAPERMDRRFLDEDGKELDTLFDKIKNDEWVEFLDKATGDAETTSEVIATYDSSIRFVDEQISALVDFLKKKGIFEDTIIIITSDHGESLTEHGIYFDHHGLYDPSIRVPLIISNLSKGEGHTIDQLVQHVDVVPTILEELGIRDEHIPLDGRSVFPLLDSEEKEFRPYIYTEETLTAKKQSIRTEDWKYIKAASEKEAVCSNCGFIHGDMEELYDLREDPEEEENIVDEQPHKKEELEEKMKEFKSRTGKKTEEKVIQQSIEGISDEI